MLPVMNAAEFFEEKAKKGTREKYDWVLVKKPYEVLYRGLQLKVLKMHAVDIEVVDD